MSILYKLTDEDGRTYGGIQWCEGTTHTATGDISLPLCTNSWIHAYESPDIAVLMNPIHAKFKYPLLWEAEGEIGIRDGGLKCGCRSLTTVRRLELPEWRTDQRAAFAIYCVLGVYKDPQFTVWSDNWLNGQDRSGGSAVAAAWAAAEAAAAEAAAAEAAAWAAWAAGAAGAAEAIEATWAAEAAAKAAKAAVAVAGADFDILAAVESAKQWAKEEAAKTKGE